MLLLLQNNDKVPEIPSFGGKQKGFGTRQAKGMTCFCHICCANILRFGLACESISIFWCSLL